VLGTGPSVYGSDPDLDALFQEQVVFIDVGPRVEEPVIGLMPLVSFTTPYEKMRLKRP
jgi:hypothetical protein